MKEGRRGSKDKICGRCFQGRREKEVGKEERNREKSRNKG